MAALVGAEESELLIRPSTSCHDRSESVTLVVHELTREVRCREWLRAIGAMPQRLLARMPTREQLEARIMIILTLMGGLAQIAQVSLDMLVQLLMSDLSGYYVSAGIMLTEDATTRIDAHANAQWAIVQSGDVPAGLRLGDEVIISGLAGRADLNEKAGEIIGRYDAAAERFPVNVGGENVRIRCKNLRAVQGAYETPIANGCDVSKSYGYSVKDGRREPSTNPLAPELCLALGAKSAAEMAAAFAKAQDSPCVHKQSRVLALLARLFFRDLYQIMRFYRKSTETTDIPSLTKEFGPLTDFETFLNETNWGDRNLTYEDLADADRVLKG